MSISNVDVTVLCVRFGTKYGIEYVEKLRNMVSRHLTVPYEFACITDDPTPISGVRLIVQPLFEYRQLWWHKVHMFDPQLETASVILYFDLDVVICNSINRLVLIDPKKLYGIRDFNRKFMPNLDYLNSSVMCWARGHHSELYTKFKTDTHRALMLRGDQDWIWAQSKRDIQFWPTEWIQSYKWEIRSKSELVERSGDSGFKFVSDVQPSPECCVAVFHGNPNPADVPDTFVVTNWK